MRERGQSDVLGYVFVFAIVVAATGLALTAGLSGLQDARDIERANDAERAFEMLQDDIEDVIGRGVPTRSTGITVADASLGFGGPVTITVSEADGGFTSSRDIEPIVYEANAGVEIAYAAGAVIRRQDGGGIVTHTPGFVLSAERTVIPIVQTRPTGSASIGGDATVLVRTTAVRRQVVYASADESVTLWLNLTTPRADAWHDHLGGLADVTCEPVAGETVACRVTTDRAYVTLVRIGAELG
jgi:hypothetical protein